LTDRTKETMEHLGDRAHEMKDRLNEKLHTTSSDKMSPQAKDQAKEKYQQMTDRSQELYQRSMNRASEMGHRVRERYARQKYRARTMLEDHPLAIAAIGVGIGALLGALLPTSRREQRWLRDTRDGKGHTLMENGPEEFASPPDTVKVH